MSHRASETHWSSFRLREDLLRPMVEPRLEYKRCTGWNTRATMARTLILNIPQHRNGYPAGRWHGRGHDDHRHIAQRSDHGDFVAAVALGAAHAVAPNFQRQRVLV